MAKTQATIDLENALAEYSRKRREYGCREVTIGFQHDGHGDEIVDFMTMDARAVFRCYELKVSLADLKTDNKKSFYGDYNYLVVSDQLFLCGPVWDNWIPPYCGILSGPELKVRRNAKKKQIDPKTREMLKDSLIRTLYWKMVANEDAERLSQMRTLEKDTSDELNEIREQLRISERKVWTYDDYEHYYRLNHQDPSFSIEHASKEERRQYVLRREHQLVTEGKCPCCGRSIAAGEKWCPECGMDLRKLHE